MRKTFALLAVPAVVLGLALPPAGAQPSEPPLTFHQLTPCVLFDTRPSQGGTGALGAGEARSFHVVGSTSDFAGQGGAAGGCGIPGFSGGSPVAAAAYINLVAIDPTGGGNLRIWPTDQAEPSGGVVNYQKLTPNLNNSNAIITGVRQDTEGSDITVRANVSGTHVRGVALGYLTSAEGLGWLLEGNAGTDPATHFVGTTDNQPLNVRVNNARALRLEPGSTPNLVGGHAANSVTGGMVGATIAGGGNGTFPNQVTGHFGTVSGGVGNSAGDTASVPGGQGNAASGAWSFAGGRRAKADHQGAFVWADSIDANFASDAANEFAVRANGGVRFFVNGNTCALDVATGQWDGTCASPTANAWLLGGNAGTTAGTDFLGTTDFTALEVKVNSLRALRLEPTGLAPNLLGGSPANTVTAAAVGATISGGGETTSPNKVTDRYGTVGGGVGNQAGDDAGTPTDAQRATVGGGILNTASAADATVGGGQGNAASGGGATVDGGWTNTAAGTLAVIGGGGSNAASGADSTIAGGNENIAGALGATVGGGRDNEAAADFATIAGGGGNGVGNAVTGSNGTVGGGSSNSVGGILGTIGGGTGNAAGGVAAFVGGGSTNVADGEAAVIGGGSNNTAGGHRGTVGGGQANTASGFFATVPGGLQNTAQGRYSVAAGRQAKANHDGAFVWGDSQGADMASTAADQFIVRAQGNVFVQSDSTLDNQGGLINTSTGAFLSTAGVWTDVSSEEVKTRFAPVEPGKILEGVASLPVTAWSYRGQEDIRHIGPTAEDFHAAFGVGESPRHLASLDTGGVALAAIQGLNQKVEKIEARHAPATAPAGPTLPTSAWLSVAAAIGLLGLGLGRRWERRSAAAA